MSVVTIRIYFLLIINFEKPQITSLSLKTTKLRTNMSEISYHQHFSLRLNANTNWPLQLSLLLIFQRQKSVSYCKMLKSRLEGS